MSERWVLFDQLAGSMEGSICLAFDGAGINGQRQNFSKRSRSFDMMLFAYLQGPV
jgi:hypothetical protein